MSFLYQLCTFLNVCTFLRKFQMVYTMKKNITESYIHGNYRQFPGSLFCNLRSMNSSGWSYHFNSRIEHCALKTQMYPVPKRKKKKWQTLIWGWSSIQYFIFYQSYLCPASLEYVWFLHHWILVRYTKKLISLDIFLQLVISGKKCTGETFWKCLKMHFVLCYCIPVWICR